MQKYKFKEINNQAFTNHLKTIEYELIKTKEITIDNWYKLSFDEAEKNIKFKDKTYFEHKKEQSKEIPNSWLKLITSEMI